MSSALDRPAPLLLGAFGAGVATGLLHTWIPALVAGVLLLALRGAGRPSLWLGGAILLGALHGDAARREAARSCAATLRSGSQQLRLQILDPSGGMGRAFPLDRGCRGPITVRWPATDAAMHPAGAVVTATGRWRGDGRHGGVFLLRTAARTGGTPGPVDRLRTGAERAIGRLYGARAPVVEAVLLGRRDGLDPRLRDTFAAAGLVHLLAISGFHVGLVAGWLFLLLRFLRLGRPRALGAAAAGAVAYAAFLGWPPPATRAALLAALAAWGRIRQRRIAPGALLSVALLLVLLLDPWAVTKVGAWLSGAAVAGVIIATGWARHHARGRLAAPLAASIGATLATAPITAFAFGSVSVVGVPLNLVAIPLAAIAVPGVLASVALELVGLPAGALAAGTGLSLLALERLADFGAGVPFGVVITEPGPRASLPWLLTLGVFGWMAGVGRPGRGTTAPEAGRRGLLAVTAGTWVLLFAGFLPGRGPGPDTLALYFLDVGQGDAAAIRTPGGRWVVVDAGPASERSDAGRRVVLPFLRRNGARDIAVLIVSHAHLDHLGGAGTLLGGLPVGVVVEPAIPVAESPYLTLLAQIDSAGTRWTPARRGMQWETDGVRFTVLHPDPDRADWGLDLNEDSAVLLVEFGEFRALFTGDAGHPMEAGLEGQFGPITVLKVGHHGSRGATGTALLDETRPEIAVISVGAGNRHGHPAKETLARLHRRGVAVWQTDRDGSINVETDGHRLVRIWGRQRDTVFAPRRNPIAREEGCRPRPGRDGGIAPRTGCPPRSGDRP